MNSSDFIKDNNIDDNLDLLNKLLVNEKWNTTDQILEKTKNLWQKNVRWLQFSVERSEIRKFNTGIARLQGSLIARDKSEALIEINNIKQIWQHLGD